MSTQTRDVTPLSTRAALGSVDLKNRTAEVTFTTGAKVLRSSWLDGPFYEELSLDPAHVRMERLQSGAAPFLADHDASLSTTLGVVESARLEKTRGVATIRFAPEGVDPEADKVFAKMAAGVIRNVSVGYRVHKLSKVEGGDSTTPTFRVVDWTPLEISAVAIGADAGAIVRSEVKTNPCLIVGHTTRGTSTMEGNEVNTEDLAQIERERISGIRSAVKAAHLGDDLAVQLIRGNVPIDKARIAVLDVLATRDAMVPTAQAHVSIEGDSSERSSGITMGTTEGDKVQRGMVSALLARANPDLVKEAKAKQVPGFESVDTGSSDFRAMSVRDMARFYLERRGVKTHAMGNMKLVGEALTRSGPYGGRDDFPVMLENAIGKSLLAAYLVTPDVWSKVCGTASVPDFRASPRYRAGSIGVLDSLNENGEFKNKSIPDAAKLSISTATKGNMIGISRQALVNDDLGGFMDLAAKLGRAAKLSIEADFFTLLGLNGGLGPTVGANPFFHSTNGNVNAVASAITAAGIDADRVVMGAQRDAQNLEFLSLRPAVLLIPLSQGSTARVLNASAINPAGTVANAPNPVQGVFREVIDTPRLSGTRRYLFANPSELPAFVCAFLDGVQEPTLENEQGWRVDGTEMKVRFDYLVQAFDVKGALTNAGA